MTWKSTRDGVARFIGRIIWHHQGLTLRPKAGLVLRLATRQSALMVVPLHGDGILRWTTEEPFCQLRCPRK